MNDKQLNILDKLKSKGIKMKPKTHFIFKKLILILLALFVAIFSLYVVSFILFNLKTSGAWYLSGFGFGGVGMFLRFVPWHLVLLAMILIAVLEFFSRKLAFVYRHPLLYSFLGILALFFIGGFLIDKAQIHSSFFLRAEEGRLPVMDYFYKNKNEHGCGVCMGVVSEINDNSIIVQTKEGESLIVEIDSKTLVPRGKKIKEKDVIVIMGENFGTSSVKAKGIKPVGGDMEDFMKKRMRSHMRIKMMK